MVADRMLRLEQTLRAKSMDSLKVIVFLLGAVSLATGGSVRSAFHGEVSDSQCAMNVHSLSHSHKEMTTKKTMGTDRASCARACVRRGGEWVLRSGNEIYRLKNQIGIEEFAGQNVKVIGILEAATNTIDNASIGADGETPTAPH
jgi:hypothetical protein